MVKPTDSIKRINKAHYKIANNKFDTYYKDEHKLSQIKKYGQNHTENY